MDKILKAKLNMMKVVRAKVRLKYALKADDEIRDLIPVANKAFDKAVMQSKLNPAETFNLMPVLAAIGEVLDAEIGGAGE